MDAKHDPEMCFCPKCIKTLLKAHDAYLKRWLKSRGR